MQDASRYKLQSIIAERFNLQESENEGNPATSAFGRHRRVIVYGVYGESADRSAETHASPCALGHYNSVAGWRRNPHDKRGTRREQVTRL
jgi:hypothetical protein